MKTRYQVLLAMLVGLVGIPLTILLIEDVVDPPAHPEAFHRDPPNEFLMVHPPQGPVIHPKVSPPLPGFRLGPADAFGDMRPEPIQPSFWDWLDR